MANFYNIYNPAQGTVGGLLSLPNFANPVQFICGGTFDVGASPDNYKRAEICRQRMGPVLQALTMNYPPIMFHPINSITAYKGQIIYDTPETEAKAQTPVPYLQWQPAPGVTPPPMPTRTDLSDLLVPPAPGRQPAQAGARSRRPARRAGPARPAARHRRPRPPLPAERRGQADDVPQGVASAQHRGIGSGAVLLAGCQFGGLNSLDMPGTAGHGTGSYTITVELPDVATLPQNSPVMVDDVTVGSVSGIDAMQRPDGTFYAAVKLSLDQNVNLPANATAKVAQTSLLGSQHVDLAPPVDRAGGRAGWTRARSIPLDRTGRYPTTEEVLSSLGVVVNKGNLGALQDITDETYNAVAGRAGQFTDLVPAARRADQLAGPADRRHHRGRRRAEPLRRNPGAQQGQPRPRAGHAARGAEGAQQQPRPTSSTRSARCSSFADGRVAHARRRPRTTSPPTSRTSTRSSRRSTTTPTIFDQGPRAACRRSRSTTSTCATRCAATTSTCSSRST